MSTRLHLKGKGLQELLPQIESLTGVMFFKEFEDEVTTFTKSGNESFYDIGSNVFYQITNESIPYHTENEGYFTPYIPKTSKVLTYQSIEEKLTQHKEKIDTFLQHSFGDSKEESFRHLIEFYQFVVKYKLNLHIK